MTLAQNHADQLAASAIAPNIIQARRYATVENEMELARLDGDLSKSQRLLPALLIPIYKLGEPKPYTVVIRPDTPRVEKKDDGTERAVKYEWPAGKPLCIDVLPMWRDSLKDTEIPIWFTEGAKKADALSSLGQSIIPASLNGVWCWRTKDADGTSRPLADFNSLMLKGRTTVLAFDSDHSSNPNVRQALDAFADFMTTERSAKVGILKLPDGPDGKKWGVDDAIAAGWTFEQLQDAIEWYDPRPRIPVRDLDIPTVVKAAWQALIGAGFPLYRRDGVLLEVTRHDDGTPILRDVSKSILRGYLARVALFVQYREKKGKAVEWVVEPPPVIVDDMLTNVDSRIPLISQITRCPVVTAQGDIILTPGYHADTHLYYAPRPGVEIPPIPETPNADDMAAARSLILDDLLYDFPFVSEADRTHAVAMMLLPYLRDCIRGPTPLHLVEAPNAGSGKGELVRAVLTPAFGPLKETPEQPNDSEWKKRLLADLLTTPSLIYCDNINRPIDSGSLALAVTSTIFSDRLLGSNTMASAPVRCMWVFTGNNPTMSGEIARRSIRIRIDPKMDRPQLRKGFKHNIRQWVYDHQGDLIAAALTLIRYGLQAETRKPPITLGSFEEWSRVLFQILDACDLPGFLGNLLELYDRSDTEGVAWRGFVAAWWEKFEGELVPVGKLFDLFKEGEYEINIKGQDDKAQRVAFGKALKKQQDRVIGEHQVVFHGIAHKTNVWKLVPVNAGGDGEIGGGFYTPAARVSVDIEITPIHVENDGVVKPPQPPQPPPTFQQVLEPAMTLAPGVEHPRIEPDTIAIDRGRLQELMDGGLPKADAQRQAVEEARHFDDLARRYEEARGMPLNRAIWSLDELDELEAQVVEFEALLEAGL